MRIERELESIKKNQVQLLHIRNSTACFIFAVVRRKYRGWFQKPEEKNLSSKRQKTKNIKNKQANQKTQNQPKQNNPKPMRTYNRIFHKVQ